MYKCIHCTTVLYVHVYSRMPVCVLCVCTMYTRYRIQKTKTIFVCFILCVPTRCGFYSNGGIVLYWPTDIHFRVDNSNIILLLLAVAARSHALCCKYTHTHTSAGRRQHQVSRPLIYYYNNNVIMILLNSMYIPTILVVI